MPPTAAWAAAAGMASGYRPRPVTKTVPTEPEGADGANRCMLRAASTEASTIVCPLMRSRGMARLCTCRVTSPSTVLVSPTTTTRSGGWSSRMVRVAAGRASGRATRSGTSRAPASEAPSRPYCHPSSGEAGSNPIRTMISGRSPSSRAASASSVAVPGRSWSWTRTVCRPSRSSWSRTDSPTWFGPPTTVTR